MKELREKMQAQFDKMCATSKLFRSTITGREVWDMYLKSFPTEHNPIFRDPNSTVHNCNLCNNFIRRYGNIVALDEYLNIMTIWDVEIDGEYSDSVKTISDKLNQSGISDIFMETFDSLNSLPYEKCTKQNEKFQLGIPKNVKRYTKEESEKYGVVKPNEIREFNHFMLMLPKTFVDMSGKSIEAITGLFRDAKNVFKRAMDEIPLDTLMLVRDLINQGSLLDGQTHLYKIEQIIPFKKQYDLLSEKEKDVWSWNVSYGL